MLEQSKLMNLRSFNINQDGEDVIIGEGGARLFKDITDIWQSRRDELSKNIDLTSATVQLPVAENQSGFSIQNSFQ